MDENFIGLKKKETCTCPVCGYSMPKPLNVPCNTLRCPRCGSAMS